MKNVTGWDAIEMKRNNDAVKLNKYADPTEGARSNLSIEDAEDVAREDPILIYVEEHLDYHSA